jgi:predicted RNA binding protein YcfA (HicA-like mRNA interferase family)
MTPKEAEKMILAAGWRFDRQKGSHRQYRHPQHTGTVTIAFHRGDLEKFVVNSIMKQARLK